jgi:hypothetical protein
VCVTVRRWRRVSGTPPVFPFYKTNDIEELPNSGAARPPSLSLSLSLSLSFSRIALFSASGDDPAPEIRLILAVASRDSCFTREHISVLHLCEASTRKLEPKNVS